MLRHLPWLLCCSLAAAVAPAQARAKEAPVPASVCQLQDRPSLYDRKLVEVRGRVYFGKFDFVIEGACRSHTAARVWLDVGGDVESPYEYWGVAGYLTKRKGTDVRVRNVSIPVVHNALLDDFLNDVGAIRFRKPNGDPCGSECLLYEVTATLRGKFFSGTRGGFGMNGCCHLLVIEEATNVSSKRTQVPAGGVFECTSERWDPTPEELRKFSAIPACSLRDDFKKCEAVLAKHWGDIINPRDSVNYPGPWLSPDMTRSYAFLGSFVQEPGQPVQMVGHVVRKSCRAVVLPKPASDHVHCRFYWSLNLDNVQKIVNGGTDARRASDMARVAWLAFQQASKQWSLADIVQVRLSACAPFSPPFQGPAGNLQQWGSCTWLAPDDMQEIIVELHKTGDITKPTGPLEDAAWLATHVQANLCRADSRLLAPND